MGMDCYLWSARNHEVFKHDGWWNSGQIKEEWYSRKCWDLVLHCSFIPKDYESGDFLELSRENLEEMIKVACQYKNYWGNYNDVPKLCEIRDKFFGGYSDETDEDDEDEAEDRKLYLEYDW